MSTQYSVQQGDCILSIAANTGFPWKKLWDHPDNAQLRKLRQDPSVLYRGDVVIIPDPDVRVESRPTDAQHTFKKIAEQAHIKIRLCLDDQPRASLKYELTVAGTSVTGSTDSDGFLQEDIPPDAENGVLVVNEGACKSIYQLEFGTLDPIDTDDGVRERLVSLGYDAEGDLAGAAQDFQNTEGLAATGTIDDTLRAKLKEKFGQ